MRNLYLVVLPTVGGARDERYSGVISFCILLKRTSFDFCRLEARLS